MHRQLAACRTSKLQPLGLSFSCKVLLCLSWSTLQGLLPLYLSPQTGKFSTNKVALGAMGDS